MRYMVGIGISFAFYLMPLRVYGQIKTLESGMIDWTGYYLEVKFSEKFQLDAVIDNRRLFSPSKQHYRSDYLIL